MQLVLAKNASYVRRCLYTNTSCWALIYFNNFIRLFTGNLQEFLEFNVGCCFNDLS